MTEPTGSGGGTPEASRGTAREPAWHHTAVVYQVYLRSFADGNGDGTGDVTGLISRLGYLRDLGVTAIWLNPWYVSPLADGGYDVADYRDIDPRFGTLADAEELLAAAHSHGLKVIVDLVPNHCSDRHRWFTAALAAGPGSAERARFWFRPGRGEAGERPPNNWQSEFGGPAWHRVTEADGRPGEWYLHLYAPEQPDLNWDNPEVRAEFEDVLRFWLDRGVDGFRIDVADALVKDPALPDVSGPRTAESASPWKDQPGLHDIYRSWRQIIDSYPGNRVLVGEMWIRPLTRVVPYLLGDQLHTAFNFGFLSAPWQAGSLREVIDTTLTSIGAAAPWVLSNHDVTRHVTRYGRKDTARVWPRPGAPVPVDLALGTRRARAAILLMLALPGSAYLYQGEELGLWEVEDLPEELLDDPIWRRTDHAVRGRDGCRVPVPWHAGAPGFGFGPPDGAPPWLPQPAAWKALAADAEAADPGSMLSLYKAALALRAARDHLADNELTWLDAPSDVLVFRRPAGLCCVVNFSEAPVPLPPHDKLLLTSIPLEGDLLPPDSAAWLQV